MNIETAFEVIIVGGSNAGLSAAMALGRSLRKVLVIDSNEPCNRQTPHSHNFITQDGNTPAQIANAAREQVETYPSVSFTKGKVIDGKKINIGFEVTTDDKRHFTTRKLLFATGIKDIMPNIPGFAACWGISVLHCPYCHGYEVKDQPMAIMANGDIGFEFAKMIYHWSRHLTLLTNGKSTLSAEQTTKLQQRNIAINEQGIAALEHTNGQLQQIHFADGSKLDIGVLFARVPYEQHSHLPAQLGCQLTEQGFIQVNDFKQTNLLGVYAAGDNTTMFRSVAYAVGAGNIAGAMLNRELITEDWQ